MYLYEFFMLFPSETKATIRKATGSENGKILYRVYVRDKIVNLLDWNFETVKNAEVKNGGLIVTIF